MFKNSKLARFFAICAATLVLSILAGISALLWIAAGRLL